VSGEFPFIYDPGGNECEADEHRAENVCR
jgi:hypothetical protein